MISANDLKNKQFSVCENGYDKKEVDALIAEASQTISSYTEQSNQLYKKMEVLASKVEEYREEEDSIKSALLIAQKMADKIKKESKTNAEELISNSQAKAQLTITQAQARSEEIMGKAKEILEDSKSQADSIIKESREAAKLMLDEKINESNAIIAAAEKKANDAINSSKIVAQNILDQAKEISEDLISKSQEEHDAYELLVKALKDDAKGFISNIINLYHEQLTVLENAQFDSNGTVADVEDNIGSIDTDVKSLVNEIDEMKDAIPSSVSVDSKITDEEVNEIITSFNESKSEIAENEPQEAEDFEPIDVDDEEFDDEDEFDDVQETADDEDDEIEEIIDDAAEDEDQNTLGDFVELSEKIEENADAQDIVKEFDDMDELEEVSDDEADDESDDTQDETDEEEYYLPDVYEEPIDPMEAVKAFSDDEVTPLANKSPIPEIDDDEDSLFDEEEEKQPFENYFHIKRETQHTDRTQTISLVPPDDDDDEDEDDGPKFKGFFKKKK